MLGGGAAQIVLLAMPRVRAAILASHSDPRR
jgi:hypothetical protein